MSTRVSKSFLGKNASRFPVVPAIERTFEGRVFDSKLEMMRWATLSLWQKAGMICELTYHPKYEVFINGIRVLVYTADSKYRDPKTGAWTVEDVKSKGMGGTGGSEFRLRKRLVEAFHGIEITVVEK